MAGSIGGQAIISPDLSKVPLLADMQYYEPYSSQGLNRKLRNIVLPGIYNGFNILPDGGLNLRITSTSVGGGAISFNIEDRYQISLQQINDYVLPMRAGSWTVIAQVDYRFGIVTDQVQQSSPIKAAEITYIPTGQALTSNQMELCRVIIPATASQITDLMIDLSHRVHRMVGMLMTDEVNLQKSDIVASAWAVKKAFDEAQKASASKLGLNNGMGIGQNTIKLAQNFDWQKYEFHGDEYVYIRWEQTLNPPADIDYPNGYYQISVLGLSDTDNQSLMIRPVNYQEPLAPFMISWTGGKGNRLFRTRAVVTAQGDINLLNKGPNDLKRKCHIGQYSQPMDIQAIASRGYPDKQAGCLYIEPSIQSREIVAGKTVNGGVIQRYITYRSNRMFVRSMDEQGIFLPWREIPHLSSDLMMDGGKKLGINALERNSVYLTNGHGQLGNFDANKIVSATVYEWYNDSVTSGIRRNNTTGIVGYSIQIGASERMRVTPTGEVQAYGSGMAAAADSPAYRFLNATANTELGKIQIRSNEMHLSYNDGTDFALGKHGLRGVGIPTGASGALISGTTQGGAWATWKTNSAGLLLNAPSDNNAYSVWKAVKGADQIAGMAIARTNATTAAAYLHVMNVDFKFNSSGLFEAAAALFSGNAKAKTFTGETISVTTSNVTGTATANKIQASSWVAVHDNDSGLYGDTDGKVSFYANNAEQGYWNVTELHWNRAITAAGQITGAEALNVIAPNNKHLYFKASNGAEKGLVYCDVNGNMFIRANNSKTYTFSNSGTFTSAGAINGGAITGSSIKSNGEVRCVGNVVIDNASVNRVIYFMQGTTERGVLYVNQSGQMRFRLGAKSAEMVLDSSANLSSPGTASFKDVYISSDRKLKRDLKPFKNVLVKLAKLQGYLYEIRNGEDEWSQSGGLIAQEIQAEFPELVATNPETGMLRLNYNGMIGVLVTAINELAGAL
ncbi:pyocin knob domain-containing S74 family peptidase [Enterobacter hormaechei]